MLNDYLPRACRLRSTGICCTGGPSPFERKTTFLSNGRQKENKTNSVNSHTSLQCRGFKSIPFCERKCRWIYNFFFWIDFITVCGKNAKIVNETAKTNVLSKFALLFMAYCSHWSKLQGTQCALHTVKKKLNKLFHKKATKLDYKPWKPFNSRVNTSSTLKQCVLRFVHFEEINPLGFWLKFFVCFCWELWPIQSDLLTNSVKYFN